MPELVLPILFIVSDIFFDSYPLKQFAPVIHGNRQARGRIAMGKTPRRMSVTSMAINKPDQSCAATPDGLFVLYRRK